MERRDELSAHTFARKRRLAAFLQPESRVSDEEAPRPVRAMMPSTVMSIVLVVGCIAWGAIAPSAPPGWDNTGEYIIVDTDSTTRYVVLPKEGKDGKKVKTLHPVLNFASAKLVLDKGKGEVIEVAGEDINDSGIARGATIGIPYAPDRLPAKDDAEASKEWAVCEKPGAGSGGQPQQAVFVLGGQDKDALKDKNRLAEGEALFVQDAKTGDQYIVDGNGTKLMLAGLDGKTNTVNRGLLTKLVLRDPGEPQVVSPQWLNTLQTGDPVEFPDLTSSPGTPVDFPGAESLPEEARKVGMVLKSNAGGTDYYNIVLSDGLQQTTPLYAKLMMGGLDLQTQMLPVKQLEVAEAGATSNASGDVETGGKGWPKDVVQQVNRAAEGIGSTSRTVSCSVYTGKIENGRPELAAWAGGDYPAKNVAGTASAYVSSGSGLLYQEFSGTGGGGQQYLLTDSGLRYGLGGKASARLGYEKAKVAAVPQNWSALLPKGPTLDTESASQEQGM
jgi:type VII secretion protein EccB